MSKDESNNDLELLRMTSVKVLKSSVTFAILISFIIVYLLQDFVNHTSLYIWFIVVTLLNLCRILSTKNIENSTNRSRSIRIYEFNMILLALSWASISLITINQITWSTQGLLNTFVIGYSVAAGINNIAHKKIALVYSNSIILFMIVRILVEDNEHKGLLVLSLIMFLYLITKMVLILNKQFVENAKLLIEVKKSHRLEAQKKEQEIKNLKISKIMSLADVTAGIAHEINNPLSIILGQLEVLKMKHSLGKLSDEDLSKNLDKLIKTSFRVRDIISLLKGMCSVEKKGKLERVNISEIINKACLKILLSQEEDPPQIINEVCEKSIVYGFEDDLEQVICILIQNAIYAVKDETVKKICIEQETINKTVQIKVYDSGRGVQERIKERIFEPFFSTKDTGQGMGIGLSLGKSLMIKNGGDLCYETDTKGHYFKVSLEAI